jgi:hypothetical protein
MTQFINTASLTSEDKALIDKIVGRALSLKISPNKMTTEMDITAVHCNCGGVKPVICLKLKPTNSKAP